MNFGKKSKYEANEKYFFGVGVGGEGEWGLGGGFQPKKPIGIHLFFCAHALYKISSSWLKWFSSLNTNKLQEKRTGKGHNSANVFRNSVKSHLKIDPKQSSEFQDPSSSNSLHIVLTRFFYNYKS